MSVEQSLPVAAECGPKADGLGPKCYYQEASLRCFREGSGAEQMDLGEKIADKP